MRPLPAALQTAVATETPYGGRTAAWVDTAVVWIELKRSTPVSTDASDDAPPQRLERAEARARAHPALVPGVRLAAGGGPPWSVTDVRADDPVPGRCLLLLERLL